MLDRCDPKYCEIESTFAQMNSKLSPIVRHGLWLTAIFLVVAGIQGMLPYFFDGDTGYHLAVARLTREYGILHAFPWTPFSWMSDHYADKELLFHLFLVPVAGLEPSLAAQIAGTLLGAVMLATLYILLVTERVSHAGWWAVLPLAASSAFIYRIALVRPHLMSITLALLISWSAARKRWLILGVASFLFPLCYTAWHLPVALILIVETARWVSVREVEWRSILTVIAGLIVGITIHPNFPANLELFWIQNVTVLVNTVWAEKAGFEMGAEFEPFNLISLILFVLIPAAITAAAAMIAWTRRQTDFFPLALAVTAIGFFAVTLRTQRFIEYLVPFGVFALAVAWRPVKNDRLAPLLVVVSVIWIALVARYPIELLLIRDDAFPPTVAAELRKVIPEREQVVTCDWKFTGEMMLALPERKFMVALDPVFFAMKDAELYRTWFETINDPLPNAATVLREKFDARYVLCRNSKDWNPLMKYLAADSNARFLGVHGIWVAYELLNGPDRS
jgi:hypothetical protein